MNILNIPYFAGGLSHLIPLYVLHQKYLRNYNQINSKFLAVNSLQSFLQIQGVDCVSMDYFSENQLQCLGGDYEKIAEYLLKKHKEAYKNVKPDLIFEDTSTFSPLIAEKNNVPRISIQRTGIFRSIPKRFRNKNHFHSLQKGSFTKKSDFFTTTNYSQVSNLKNSELRFLNQYANPKVKVIPGIPAIECLPNNIPDRKSYFYSGPLIVMDKPSKKLSSRLDKFLETNNNKPIVFITTGTVDKTPIEKFIAYFLEKKYAVITTCVCKINNIYKENVFFNNLFPLNYICSISDLVVHQCGSGMYHYPIMNRVATLTIGTQCYDREDVAQRLEQLGVSGHIPHPDDHPDYWNIFIELLEKFEKNTLIDYEIMDQLRNEIRETTLNFKMEKVIEYALA